MNTQQPDLSFLNNDKKETVTFGIMNERNQYETMKDVLNSEHVMELVTIENIKRGKKYIHYEISCTDKTDNLIQTVFALGTNYGAMLHKRKLVQIADCKE